MTTLYRKYRPKNFAEVTDQDLVVETLSNEIKNGSIAHAYLFSGPRGIGKTSLARLLAKAINCTDRAKNFAEPCNKCSTCLEINAGRHIDIIEIDAASQTGVDNVRENIIENARFKATKALYKVFIIDEVHMLSTSAFSALLKTLEEPPAQVVFILATTELDDLPATVISRCERFHFRRISREHMLKRLAGIAQAEQINVEKEVLERIVDKSQGGLRDAESLLGQILSLPLKKITLADSVLFLPAVNHSLALSFLEKCLENGTGDAIGLLHREIENGVSVDQFMRDLIDVLRALLLIITTGGNKEATASWDQSTVVIAEKLAKKVPLEHITKLIDIALKREQMLANSPLPTLPLELFAAEAGGLGKAPALTKEKEAEKKTEFAPTPTPPPAAPPVNKVEPSSPVTTIKVAARSTPVNTTIVHIKEKWRELLEKVGAVNHTLPVILNVCKPDNMRDNTLVVSVPFSLHKEKLDQAKNRLIVESTLETLFAEKILFACEVIPTVFVPEPELSGLAMEFGGQVLE